MPNNKMINISIIFVMMLIVLSACYSNNKSTKSNVEQIDYQTAQQFFQEDKNGYLLIYIDDDNNYLSYIKEISKRNNVKVYLYNPYQSDGKNENKKPLYPNKREVNGNMLYYIENKKINKELNVNAYEGSDLEKEIVYFLK